jgi:N-acetylmuramic acid 6-phosphate etherase
VSELPADTASTTEERNPATADLDKLGTAELVAKIQQQDFAVADAVRLCVPDIAHVVDGIVEKLLHGGRLFYFGAGTSGRLGVLDAAECPPTFGVESSLVQAFVAGGRDAVFVSSEEKEDFEESGAADVTACGVGNGDAVVGICASGRTPFVVGALKQARSVGAFTVLITNNAAAGGAADVVIAAVVGPEALTGSTRMKAGSAQKMILNLISTSVMVKMGRVYENLMVDLRPKSKKLYQRALRIIMMVTGVSVQEAEKALAAANNSSKTAILMLKRGCSLQEAESRLAQHKGFLRKALAQ